MSPPPQPPIINSHTCTSLPNLFFKALSICFLFSSSPKPYLSKLPFLHFPSNPRRFLQIPTMSLPPQTPKTQSHNFTNPQSLSYWLKPDCPPTLSPPGVSNPAPKTSTTSGSSSPRAKPLSSIPPLRFV